MSEIHEQANLLRQVRQALQQNDITTAIISLKRLSAMAEAQSDWSAAARHLGNLALVYYRAGDAQHAIESFVQGIAWARQDQDRLTENGLLGNMGNILREMRQYPEAIKCLNEALLIAQSLGDLRGRGIWLANLGLVYDDLQQPAQARDLHGDAVEVARQLLDQSNLAARLGNLGNSALAMGDMDGALDAFEESIELWTTLGRRQEAALRLGIVGNIYAQLGRTAASVAEAAPHFASALENYHGAALIARQLSDYPSEAELLRSMGRILVEIGHPRDALPYLQASAHYFTQLNMPEKLREVQGLLSQIRA